MWCIYSATIDNHLKMCQNRLHQCNKIFCLKFCSIVQWYRTCQLPDTQLSFDNILQLNRIHFRLGKIELIL